MTRVTSSAIRAVSYDAARRDLRVTFHTTGIYIYHGVPAELHEGLRKAESLGRFYNAHIKDRFPFTHIARRSA